MIKILLNEFIFNGFGKKSFMLEYHLQKQFK